LEISVKAVIRPLRNACIRCRHALSEWYVTSSSTNRCGLSRRERRLLLRSYLGDSLKLEALSDKSLLVELGGISDLGLLPVGLRRGYAVVHGHLHGGWGGSLEVWPHVLVQVALDVLQGEEGARVEAIRINPISMRNLSENQSK